MNTAFKFVLFFSFIYLVAIAGYRIYKYLNEKLIGSTTVCQLLGFTLLLIAANLILFFGGLFVFISTYSYLTFPN